MNWKKIGKHLLFPHPAIAALMTLLAAAGLVYSMVRLESRDVLSIAAYTLSFYTLVILCLRVPGMIAFIRRFRTENRWYLRYSTDVQLRMKLSLLSSFVWNAAYSAFQLALGLLHRSAWFYAMAIYYFLLAGMRYILGRHLLHHAPGEAKQLEWRKYRLCGIGLMIMNLALLVFVLCFVLHIRSVSHHEIVTITMAAYTFSLLVTATVNVIRYKRYDSPVCTAAKILSLVTAMVSMLSLEDAMLSTFAAEGQAVFRRILLTVSGAAIAIFILCLSIHMILQATHNIKHEQELTEYAQ